MNKPEQYNSQDSHIDWDELSAEGKKIVTDYINGLNRVNHHAYSYATQVVEYESEGRTRVYLLPHWDGEYDEDGRTFIGDLNTLI